MINHLVEPMDRLRARVEDMCILIAQLMDMHPGVTLRINTDGWHCDQVNADVWFGDPFLTGSRLWGAPHQPWTVRGDIVKLQAVNGTWIWRLTNEYSTGINIDGEFRRRRGVWPD